MIDDKTGQLIEAGACLWEAYLDKTISVTALAAADEWRESQGTSSLRLMILNQAENCHNAWWALHKDARMDEPFDWEFCPQFLSNWIEKGGLTQ